jgi:hypothetical protein
VQDTLPAAEEAEEPREAVEAALTKAREEVMDHVYRVLDMVEHKVHAQAKAQEAKALEAHKQQLEQQMQQEQELHELKQAVLEEYKAQMMDKHAAFKSTEEAEQEHEVCVQLMFTRMCCFFQSGHAWTASYGNLLCKLGLCLKANPQPAAEKPT